MALFHVINLFLTVCCCSLCHQSDVGGLLGPTEIEQNSTFFFLFFLGKQVNFTGQNWCFSWAHSDMDELFVIAVSSTPVEMILCPGAECFSTETGGAARWMQHVNVSCKISESFFLLHIEVGVSDSGSAHNLPFGCRHIESFVKKFHKKWELNGFE